MLNTVIVARNPFEPESWTTHTVLDDIRPFLMDEFNGKWPEGARIYHHNVAQNCDITPHNEEEVRKLGELEGTFYVIVYPGGNFVVSIVIVGLMALVSTLLKPDTPSIKNYPGSSNNGLAERSNKQRVGGRIPDIYGQVLSIPDLIAVPYSVYENNTQIEYSAMCIGRGEYEIDQAKVKDGASPLAKISGEYAWIYGPGKSPNQNEDADIVLPGRAVQPDMPLYPEPIRTVRRYDMINGQSLLRPDMVIRGNEYGDGEPSQLKTDANGNLILDVNSSMDFTNYYTNDQQITVSESSGFDGVYTIVRITPGTMYIVPTMTPNQTLPASTLILGTGDSNWIGPFFCNASDGNGIVTNFIAPSGLYFIDQDDGQDPHPQRPLRIELELEITPTDADGNTNGNPIIIPFFMMGSGSNRSLVGETVRTPIAGYCQVRARRVSRRVGADGQGHPWDDSRFMAYQDQIQWIDLYTMSVPVVMNFGNVTTIVTKTFATRDARAVKERRINLLVTRKIPHWDGTKFTPPVATVNAGDIIHAVSTDPYFGRRALTELDSKNIYDTLAEVEAYFPGGSKCTMFNYTFDQDNVSFEEAIASIANAVFCQAYRRGNIIRLTFEKLTPDSVMLFNHRNKVPGTEVRSITFGRQDGFDGVEFKYVSPVDDSEMTYYVPEDRSATNPKKVDGLGIRSRVQAYYQAWRIWNKIKYQNCTIEFEATQEADLLLLFDRILVADNTRPDTQDGEVLAQHGLELTLSRPVKLS